MWGGKALLCLTASVLDLVLFNKLIWSTPFKSVKYLYNKLKILRKISFSFQVLKEYVLS